MTQAEKTLQAIKDILEEDACLDVPTQVEPAIPPPPKGYTLDCIRIPVTGEYYYTKEYKWNEALCGDHMFAYPVAVPAPVEYCECYNQPKRPGDLAPRYRDWYLESASLQSKHCNTCGKYINPT